MDIANEIFAHPRANNHLVGTGLQEINLEWPTIFYQRAGYNVYAH